MLFRSERVVALDISSEMLARGRERLRDLGPMVEFVQGDFMTTEVEGQFSLIASNAALHWFDEDLERVFGRVVSLARRNGIIAIATAGTCAEVDDFDDEVARAIPASAPHAFSRRRVDEQRLRQLAEAQHLDVLDSFLLLRSTTMATSVYATWLKASGVIVDSGYDESPSAISEPLKRHFGSSLKLRHCSVFGVFQKLD